MKSFVYNVLSQLDLDAEDKHRIGATTFANNVQVYPLLSKIVRCFKEQGFYVMKSRLWTKIKIEMKVVVMQGMDNT